MSELVCLLFSRSFLPLESKSQSRTRLFICHFLNCWPNLSAIPPPIFNYAKSPIFKCPGPPAQNHVLVGLLSLFRVQNYLVSIGESEKSPLLGHRPPIQGLQGEQSRLQLPANELLHAYLALCEANAVSIFWMHVALLNLIFTNPRTILMLIRFCNRRRLRALIGVISVNFTITYGDVKEKRRTGRFRSSPHYQTPKINSAINVSTGFALNDVQFLNPPTNTKSSISYSSYSANNDRWPPISAIGN